MSTLSPGAEAALRRFFHSMNRFMMLMWRLGLGPSMSLWPAGTGRIMVLCHTGRKSRLPRKTPLNYAIVDGDVYLAAGVGALADWYKNIKATPEVELWLPDGRWDGVAEELADDDPRRTVLMREVLRGSGFVAPLVGVDPNRLSNAELELDTLKYRLIRVRRTASRSGEGGPGDMAWVWPLVAAGAVLLAFAGWQRGVPGDMTVS
ncbi:MAG: nitroreductase family deazaflavin-dependent oxidoreductase [Chloroflexales bacterium]|nr:nitroreductase family deazaflavin-dependent oxidoreductase [Chloroflexales bacterium]